MSGRIRLGTSTRIGLNGLPEETAKGKVGICTKAQGDPARTPQRSYCFFFFFDSEFLFRAHTTKRYRGGHVCYVLRLGMYV